MHQFNDPYQAAEIPGYFRTQLEQHDDRSIPKTPTAREVPPDDTVPFRPVVRAPVAVLVVLDDGRSEGESIRLRTDTFTIGRAEGDLILPHDGLMSRKHVTISRRVDKGRIRWVLEDLGSQNGTFVRVSDAILTHNQVVMIGSRRYIFNAAPRAAAAMAAAPEPTAQTTQNWQAVTPTDLIPSITELRPDGTQGKPHMLVESEIVIGRGPECTISLDDLMVSPRHARLHRDDRGNWVIENLNSMNGTWVRVESLTFERSGQFLLGEQRFTLRV